MDPARFLEMGRVGRAHGVKGEAELFWHGETPPAKGATLYLKDDSESTATPRVLQSLRKHNGEYLATFDRVGDRTEAERLRGFKVFIDRSTLPPLEDGEAYVADLPGWNAYLENGERVGEIKRVEYPAGREIWVIIDDDGKEILFPAEPDFIVSLDQARREARLSPPPGLLEIYRA